MKKVKQLKNKYSIITKNNFQWQCKKRENDKTHEKLDDKEIRKNILEGRL